MTRWWPLAVLVLIGGLAITAGVWLRRRSLARDLTRVIAEIRPPTYRFTGLDEPLRKRTEAKRKAADAIRSRAALVETGAPVSDVLRLVK